MFSVLTRKKPNALEAHLSVARYRAASLKAVIDAAAGQEKRAYVQRFLSHAGQYDARREAIREELVAARELTDRYATDSDVLHAVFYNFASALNTWADAADGWIERVIAILDVHHDRLPGGLAEFFIEKVLVSEHLSAALSEFLVTHLATLREMPGATNEERAVLRRRYERSRGSDVVEDMLLLKQAFSLYP